MGEHVSSGDGAGTADQVPIVLPLGPEIEGRMMFGVSSGICIFGDRKEDGRLRHHSGGV